MAATGGPAPIRLAIAVPTYNESEALGPLLAALDTAMSRLPHVRATVLVIDDNSPDGTADLAESRGRSGQLPHLDVRVLHRPVKDGLGRAYVDGLSHLVAGDDHDLVLQMDADMSHDPVFIPALLEQARSADMVVGSRYVPGGATPDWKWYRSLVSRAGNAYTRLFLGSTITDYTGGFNLYSVDLLRRIDLRALRADGYGFVIELKYSALRSCTSCVQVPIVFLDRRVGASKIPRNTIAKNLVLVPRIRFRPAPPVRPATSAVPDRSRLTP